MSTSAFSAWPFSVPARVQQPVPTQAQAIATVAPVAYAMPSYIPTAPAAQYPIFTPQNNPYTTYTPLTLSNYTTASANASNIMPIYYAPTYNNYSQTLPLTMSNNYPSMSNAMPLYNTTMPYTPYSPVNTATANAGVYGNSTGGSNQLVMLLLMQLLSKLKNSGVATPTTDNNVKQSTINGDNIDNQSTTLNNGQINPTIYNLIINPKNVNISGVNTGVQQNTNTATDTKTTTNAKPELPPTKELNGQVGVLQPDGNYLISKRKKSGKDTIFKYDPVTDKTTVIQAGHSPLTLDLNGNGKIDTTAENRNDIDIDADGQKDSISKIKDDGLLFIDPNHTGQINSGAQLLGNYTNGGSFANGFDALKAVAQQTLGNQAVADGKLDANEIKQLEDKIGFGIEVNGQMKRLEDVGVTELNLDFNNTNQADAFGNTVRQTSTAVKDGNNIKLDDIWFTKQ